MATKYLDKVGLAYFWSKIKAWCNSLFALDSNVIHKNSDELITDKKFLQNTPFYLMYTSVIKGTNPSSDAYNGIVFLDNSATFSNVGHDKRFGMLQNHVASTGAVSTTIHAYKNESNSGNNAYVAVGYDANGVAYSTAISTSSSRNNGTDIVTRDWISSDIRIVHTSSNESISGDKTFSNIIYANGGIRNTDNKASLILRGGPTNNTCPSFVMYGGESTSNAGQFRIMARITNSNNCLLIGAPDGTLSWGGQAIQTLSDERFKTPLTSIPSIIFNAWEDVNWGQFQFLDAVKQKGNNARLHLGLIAQEVKFAFEKCNLDACIYGILCHEEREATEDESAVDMWTVRYTEALAMEAAYQRHKNKILENRISELENQLSSVLQTLKELKGVG